MNPFEREVERLALAAGKCPRQALRNDRRAGLPEIRQEAMWNLNLRGRSLPQVGAWAGQHHTTVLHGVRKHQTRYEAAHAERWRR